MHCSWLIFITSFLLMQKHKKETVKNGLQIPTASRRNLFVNKIRFQSLGQRHLPTFSFTISTLSLSLSLLLNISLSVYTNRSLNSFLFSKLGILILGKCMDSSVIRLLISSLRYQFFSLHSSVHIETKSRAPYLLFPEKIFNRMLQLRICC